MLRLCSCEGFSQEPFPLFPRASFLIPPTIVILLGTEEFGFANSHLLTLTFFWEERENMFMSVCVCVSACLRVCVMTHGLDKIIYILT